MFFLLALIVPSLVAAAQAPIVPYNPAGVVAVADFPQGGEHTFTKGYVIFSSPDGGKVNVHVDMTGLPQHDGPFYYHIHEFPIADSGDCETAGAHFNPYDGLDVCPPDGDDALCQVGDLSGKHGWINTTCFQTNYIDPFVSLDPASASSVVGRSVVFHYANMGRFACATINPATEAQLNDLTAYSLHEVVAVDVDVDDDEYGHKKRSNDAVESEAPTLSDEPEVESASNASYAANWTNATQLSYETSTMLDGASDLLKGGLGSLFGLLLGALL